MYLEKLAGTPNGVPATPAKLAGRMVRDGVLSMFQAESLLQGRWKRFFIGKYKVLERLGVGGMGQVFLCEHTLMKRRVALKVLPMAKAKDQASLQRFYREARAAAALDHPNIIRAYDIDEDDGLHFLVMEYVDGVNLHDLVRKIGPLPVARACHYIYGTAMGLQHAHENKLVHRDIKPANILVDRTGVVKILDMGLARFFNPDETDLLTKKFDELVIGTADYLSPEQAIDSSTADIRSDIYGLGGSFYFLLTGKPPFPDGSIAQKLLWHQSREPTPIPSLRPDVPPALAAVVSRMMAKDPALRYQTPAELMAELTPWIQTPIAPPSEQELPKLSAAATASMVRSPSSVAGPPKTPSGQKVGRPVEVPKVPSAAPSLVPLKSAAVEPESLWESITSGDTVSSSGSSTSPPRSQEPTDDAPIVAPSRITARARHAPRNNLPLALALIVGALLVLVGSVVAAILIWKPFSVVEKIPSTTSKDREPKVWHVTTGTGPDAATTRKSIAEIADLKPGDTIRLLDNTFESGFIQLKANNITLEAANAAKSVTWVYKPTGRGTPRAALDLTGVEHATIRGLTIDVGNHLDVGVQLTGSGTGGLLENVTVKNARKTGILVTNVTSDPARPLQLHRCHVMGGATTDAAVSVVGSTKSGTTGIHVLNSRLEGTGKGAGVRVDGTVTVCELRNNRVFQFEAGVSVPSMGDKFELKVEHNTFHTLTQAGVKLDQPLMEEHKVAVSRNYFAASTISVKAVGDARLLKGAENGCDMGTKPGQILATVLRTITLPKPTSETPDDQFLRAPERILLGKTPIGAE
jgi:serine/threonine protein kinase